MRIVSWNCYSGECRKRAKRADLFSPDLVVLQECTNPDGKKGPDCVWFGNNPNKKGVGVLAFNGWEVEEGTVEPGSGDSTYPVKVRGPVAFNLLAVWAQLKPTYVRAINQGIDAYRSFLKSGPSVIVGDFNSHSRWDSQDAQANHTSLVRRLEDEFGLVSAYHIARGREGIIDETATRYHEWKREKPFHIDYCFIPKEWTDRVTSVEVGGFDEWQKDSDHRPLVVSLD